MNSSHKHLIVCLLLNLLMAGVSADEPAALYSAEVAVPDRAGATQNSFLGKAFENVLVKLSGLRSLPESATPQLLAAQARSSLQSVTYHQYTLPIDEQTEFSELRMQAQFNIAAVNNALVNLGLPRWPVERMRLQFIMAVELDNQRRLISTEDRFLAFLAADTARQRGLPLDVSLEPADQEFDISWLQEIWGGFTETPLVDSRAQGYDGVLLVAASQRNGRWQLRWNMAIPAREWTWSIRNFDLHQALVEGVHQAADSLSARTAIDPTQQGRWLEPVEVVNIDNDHDYLRCMAYLQDLNLVSQVRILSARGATMRFQLELNAAPQFLHRAISRGDVLVMVGASMGSDAKIYELTK